jgi:hypothetical protein
VDHVNFPRQASRRGEGRTLGPLWVDAVEKLGDKHRVRKNRIRANGLNRCCVRDSSFEWKLLVSPLQIVFRQHRPRAAVADRLTAQPVYLQLWKHLGGVTRGKLIAMVIA